MGIVRCAILDQLSTTECKLGDAGNVYRRHNLSYIVVTDAKQDTYTLILDVNLATGIDFNAPFPTDSLAICPEGKCHCTDAGGKLYQVDYVFETPTYQKQQALENPLDRRPQISRSIEKVNRPFDQDFNGVPVQNSANDKFDPTVDTVIKFPKLTIVRNEATWSDNLYDYIETTNNATYAGAAAGRWKCVNVSAEEVNTTIDDAPFRYYAIRYEFMKSPLVEKWKRRLLDAGLRQYSGSGSGVKTNILIKNHPVTEPVKLNGSGRVLPDGASPVWLDFTDAPPANWTPLGLETYFT